MWHRLWAQRELLTTLALMVLLLTFAITGSRVALSAAAESALGEMIEGTGADERVVLVQTRYLGEEQVSNGAALLSASLPGARILPSIRTAPLPLREFDRERLTLTSAGDIAEAADILEGEWPTATSHVALQGDAAEALGVSLGDDLTIAVGDEDVSLEVVGLWFPRNPSDSQWGEDSTSRTGVDPSAAFAFGPAVVSEETIHSLDTAPFVRWLLSSQGVSAENIHTWQKALPLLPKVIEEAGLGHRGVTSSGGLGATLHQAQDSLSALNSITPIPYSLFAVVGLISLWQVFILLKGRRREETIILRARGASAARLATWSALEGLLIAVPTAGLGAAASLALGSGPSPWLIAGGLSLAVVTASTVSALPDVGGPRLRATAAPAALLFTLVLAAFTLWRMLRSTGGSSGIRMDALTISAPAATLLAIAGLTAAFLGPILGGISRGASRRSGLSPALETRLAARRGTQPGVVVLLVILAATIGVSSTYWGTWKTLRDTSEQVSAGADLSVEGRVSAESLSGIRNTAGVAAAGAVFSAEYSTRSGAGLITAIGSSGYEATSAPVTILDASLPGLLVGAPPTGPLLEAAEVRGTLSASARPTTAVEVDVIPRKIEFSLQLWNGEITQRVDLGALDVGTPTTTEPFAVSLPPGGPWRAVAVDTLIDVRANSADFAVDIFLEGADFTGFVPDVIPSPSGEYVSTGSLGFTATLANPKADTFRPGMPIRQRFMASGDPDPIPIATTPGWQGPPTETAITVYGVDLMAQPVTQISVVPGNHSPAGIFADSGALTHALLRAGVWNVHSDLAWVRTTDSALAAESLDGRVVTPSSTWTSLSILVPYLFLSLALLSILLATPAIAAAALSELRDRRGEVLVMRALGTTPGEQARYRRREFAIVLSLASLVGAAAGTLLAGLVSRPLIRSTTPQVSDAVPVTIAIDMPSAAMLTLTIVAILAALVWWYGRAVRSQASDSLWREEA